VGLKERRLPSRRIYLGRRFGRRRSLMIQPARVTSAALEKENPTSHYLPQLYRFCFLMTGDAARAQEIFQATMHEATLRATERNVPKDRFWLFRNARDRCLEASEAGLQAEELEMEEHEIDPQAAEQVRKLEPGQLAIWISGAPEPQRSALALFYLGEFDHGELLTLTELKTAELGKLVGEGRQQFQAWLNATFPHPEP
jgi:DNA-directed RNA polymerase specialized sigma24 family protein